MSCTSIFDPTFPELPTANDKFSTVARNSSTLAEIGAEPLLNGFISTWSLCSRSSSGI